MARPWRIVITGEGPSRNDKPDDADALARDMVALLKSEGHIVTAATLQDDTGKSYPLDVTAAAAATAPVSVAGPQKAATPAGTKRNAGDGQP